MSDFQATYPWLTKSMFETILRTDRANDGLCVTEIFVKPALGKGENYTSQMLRVTVSYKDASTGVTARKLFVVKAGIVGSSAVGDIVGDMGVFAKEIQNFDIVLPRVHALLRSIGDETELAPKCYAYNLEHQYIVLEDLSVRGYANLDRFLGMRVKEYRLVLSAAAKWHAATAVLYEKDPSIFNMFLDQQFAKINWRSLIQNISRALTSACEQLPKFKHVAVKLAAGQETVFKRFSDSVQSDPSGFNVLTHGDLWSNNIMFTRDATTATSSSVVLVDFQMSSYGSPLLDVMYALFSSSHDDNTAIDFEELLQFYHQELSGFLKKLGYGGRTPTLSDLHVEMQQRGLFGGLLGMFVLGVRKLAADAEADISIFMSEKAEHAEFRKEIMLSPACRRGLEFLLGYCDRKGLFDV